MLAEETVDKILDKLIDNEWLGCAWSNMPLAIREEFRRTLIDIVADEMLIAIAGHEV